MSDMQSGPPGSTTGSGRARRILISVAASAVLLGSGAAIGIALTGGASAATGSPATASVDAAQSAKSQCAELMLVVRQAGYTKAARRIQALCTRPLLRLAAIGGLHGQVTFPTSSGPKTLAFERGTVDSVSGSVLTVTAPDDTTWTWMLAANTVVRSGGHRVAAKAISRGDEILVVGQVVGGTNDARLIRFRTVS